MEEATYLAVARFRKPHGLKGEAVVFPLTDEPEAVFVPGRVLVPVDDEGRATGVEVVIHRARPYQRNWLVCFEGITDRMVLESWDAVTLGADRSELRAPDEGEMYLHEIPGSHVIENGVIISAQPLGHIFASELLAADNRKNIELDPGMQCTRFPKSS